jgi:hypothetical protein
MLRIQRIQEALGLSRPGFRTMRPVQAVCSPESNHDVLFGCAHDVFFGLGWKINVQAWIWAEQP